MTASTDVTIRSPRLAEIEEVIDLWSELVRSQRAYGATLSVSGNEDVARQYFGRVLLEDGVLVGTVEDAFVGFVSFELEPDQFDRTKRVGIVENLFVRPQHRGQGIGTALLQDAEAALERRGADTVHLEVLAANIDAQGFYESRGYQPKRIRYAKAVGTDKDNVADGE